MWLLSYPCGGYANTVASTQDKHVTILGHYNLGGTCFLYLKCLISIRSRRQDLTCHGICSNAMCKSWQTPPAFVQVLQVYLCRLLQVGCHVRFQVQFLARFTISEIPQKSIGCSPKILVLKVLPSRLSSDYTQMSGTSRPNAMYTGTWSSTVVPRTTII